MKYMTERRRHLVPPIPSYSYFYSKPIPVIDILYGICALIFIGIHEQLAKSVLQTYTQQSSG
jgi:hypothetical protein